VTFKYIYSRSVFYIRAMTVSHKKDSLPTYVTEGVNKFSDCQYD